MYRIMLLDDEPNILAALQRSLKAIAGQDELRLELFTTPADAITRLDQVNFDAIIADYHMPLMNGVQFLNIAKKLQPDAIRLMLSASAEFKTILGAINDAEIFRYIEKPWTQEDLAEYYQLAIKKRLNLLEDRHLADESRLQRGQISAQELELKKLEEQEPGITRVQWSEDGAVILDQDNSPDN